MPQPLTIYGQSFNLGGGITNSGTGLQTFGTAFTLLGNQIITSKSGGGNFRFNGAISESGSVYGLTFNGTGTTTLATNETYTGSTVVSGGGLVLTNATAGGTSLAGSLAVTNVGYNVFTYTNASGSPSLTVSSTNGLVVGQSIVGAGIAANATIASLVDATHITLSANTTAANAASVGGGAYTSAGTVNAEDPVEGTKEYEQVLQEICGNPPTLDMAHLGLGPDGHTASLTPNDPVLEVTDRDVDLTDPVHLYQNRRRMTLTYPMINRSRQIMWLATGAAKIPMIVKLKAADHSIPAGSISQANALLLTDTAAAAGL